MMGEYRDYTISELCRIVAAKDYTLPVNDNGRADAKLYVEGRYNMGKPLNIAYFTSIQKEKGFFLLSDKAIDLLYLAFILNSCVGSIFLHNEGSSNYTRGHVTKRNLSAVRITLIPERYRKACNVLELIIQRVRRLDVDDEVREIKEATVIFLSDIRNCICLEIYMKPMFIEHRVSILEPWMHFVEQNCTQYSLQAIDDTFVTFYKSIVDPENEVMDAMKKVRLFLWELVEQIKVMIRK